MTTRNAWMPRIAQTLSLLLLCFAADVACGQAVQQASSAAATSDAVAPPELGSLPTIAIPDKNEKPFSIPLKTSLGFTGGDTLSMTSVKAGTNVPIWYSGTLGNGGPDMLLTAGANFGADFLDSSTLLDVQDTLFTAGGSLTLMKRMNDRWRLVTSVNVSYKGDGDATANVVNVSGMGMAMWHKSEQVQWTFGVAATGQQNIPVIPMVGVTWKPNDDWEMSLGIPQTRIARRVDWFGPQSDTWLYTGVLGLGGGTYAVRRDSGLDDQLTIKGFPLAMGLEKRGDGTTWFCELGVVVAREIEYEVTGETEDIGEGLYARVGLKF
ncbi:DUF6268 family outer membrane beta-barrel protein [Fuerstiella marisgermanici]|uniref:DUF6268 domain-containing protein n=1 Tax=Fuerstiella marisgermanici TaxID=1891926 RepID=A0A1P8WJR5_9PLAN|nr:DUF6268 family outer membrane beta-barrel protein [Fuerstiella marisgermanici]APZ94302.1 hypothetical protein Fuma_03928 [Fuerstiella marisgermanici]